MALSYKVTGQNRSEYSCSDQGSRKIIVWISKFLWKNKNKTENLACPKKLQSVRTELANDFSLKV